MKQNFVQRHLFSVFYALAVAIVVAVMGVFFILISMGQPVLEAQGGLFQYLAEQQTYANIVSITQYIFVSHWAIVLILVFASAPTISAVVVSLLGNGSDGLRSLLDRFRPWRDNVSAKRGMMVYGGLFAVFFGVSAVFIGYAAYTSEPDAWDAYYAVIGGAPIALFFTLLLGVFIDEGATLEETGWRGFGLPLLMERFRSPL